MSSFNEKLFSQLLKSAQGKRSLNQFGLNSGVDPGYLSRFMNLKRNSPPSPEILQRLANVAHNNITYSDLMKAAGYLKEYSEVTAETLDDEDFNRILPMIIRGLSESVLKYDDHENEDLTEHLSFTSLWETLTNDDKIKLFNLIIKEAKYNKTTGGVSLTQYFVPDSEGFQTIKKDYLNFLTEQKKEKLDSNNKEDNKEKHAPVDDIEEAMKIILEQPGLMLKGSILSDESKIILANAIQMGLRTAEELEKKKGDNNE